MTRPSSCIKNWIDSDFRPEISNMLPRLPSGFARDLFLAAIAALYVTMSVGRSDGRMVGWSDGRMVGWSVSTSFKVSSNTLERLGTVIG